MVKESQSPPQETGFFDHLTALRPHLVRSAVALGVLLIVAFCSKELIVSQILMGPQSPNFPLNRWLGELSITLNMPQLQINTIGFNMINTTMAGQFNLHIKISLITAIILSIPVLLWELWRFIKPALKPTELKGFRFFVFNVSACFFVGVAFGYFIISPLAVNFLSTYQVSSAVTNMIDINSYLSTIANIVLACGIVFQLPLLVYVLSRIGILSPEFMKRYRRHAIVLLAVLSAIITPPDVFSLVLVLIPLYGLYEMSISISSRVATSRQK